MKWSELEKHFSAARLGRYRQAYQGNEVRAASAYTHNMLLAEAMMPTLNALEVALRNGVHTRLSSAYGKSDWWNAFADDANFSWQSKEVSNAKIKLQKRGEMLSTDKIIAELTFGFWSSLFNKQFSFALWRHLRFVFPRCPKPIRQRHTISSSLNQIRNLRNRVFHHEPILWITPALSDQHRRALETLGWIEPRLVAWLETYDRVPAILGSCEAI
jgi:hypothetical protein